MNKVWNVFDKTFYSFKEMCDYYGIKENTVRTRLSRNYTLEQALTQTVKQGREKAFKNIVVNNICLSEEEVRKRFQKFGYNILKYTYTTHSDKILCEDNEGYRMFVTLINVEKGGKGRKFMLSCNSKENILYNLRLYANKNNINCKILDVYNGNCSSVRMKCVCQCGNEFETSFEEFKTHNLGRCNLCTKSESNYEYKVELLLKDLGIDYEKQKRFSSCKNKNPLPFDFYLPKENILIEVDGEQHYKDYYNKKTLRKGETFKERQKLDNIKNNFCRKENIKLIRIPYYLFNKKGEYKEYFITMLND